MAVRRGYEFEVNFLGKLATWLLYASLALVMVVHGDVAALDLLDGLRARRVVSLVPVLPEGAEGDRQQERERGTGNLSS